MRQQILAGYTHTHTNHIFLYAGLFIIPWHISQNRYTRVAEGTSTCDPHRKRETLKFYLYMSWMLSFFGGCSYLNQNLPQCWIRHTNAEDQALLRWPPDCL